MKSLAELNAIKEKDILAYDYKILVGMATCGIAAGANPVMSEIKKIVQEKKLDNVNIQLTGCIGICRLEPLV
jgi:NADP-reducing hydrogenase subunit HndB